MFAIMWVVIMGVLTLAFREFWLSRYNPNQDVMTRVEGEVREVVLEANRAHHYVATGAINGEPVTFLLDTGATDIAVPAGVAGRAGLPEGQPVMFNTANGTARGYSTRIDRVELGGIVVRDVRGTINPNMDERIVLLGMSFLRELEFTQRGGELILRQQAGAGAR
ncbi:TIGR02281 family clan AA aspartic protease [Ectothiorhodospiraceae bacterium WFHF3C12]|nr:TIGR02281 family clan AA aspartic protease [Ectothiorhodospiraceae bacterium WFHF3C12]